MQSFGFTLGPGDTLRRTIQENGPHWITDVYFEVKSERKAKSTLYIREISDAGTKGKRIVVCQLEQGKAERKNVGFDLSAYVDNVVEFEVQGDVVLHITASNAKPADQVVDAMSKSSRVTRSNSRITKGSVDVSPPVSTKTPVYDVEELIVSPERVSKKRAYERVASPDKSKAPKKRKTGDHPESASSSNEDKIASVSADDLFPECDLHSIVTGDISSVKYIDIMEGGGDVVELGSIVQLRFTATTIDGSVWGTAQQELMEVQVGKGALVRGWEAGIIGMRTGGRRLIVIPPAYGYGQKQSDKIPAGSNLVIDCTVYDV
ncbi:hypothetical protein M422DRAFT_27336 [Sphaerobolus stellatus SS14]|nr:hypothetical protein M422DRAFT_27336 [Sphaerobolus stellatus SS14]